MCIAYHDFVLCVAVGGPCQNGSKAPPSLIQPKFVTYVPLDSCWSGQW